MQAAKDRLFENTPQSSNGIPRGIPLHELLAREGPEVPEEAPLHNGEQVLGLGVLVGGYTAVQPTGGPANTQSVNKLERSNGTCGK